MATLSQELLDYILDFLHTSVPSLTSSSLVSRSWLPATRHHLFRIPVLYEVSLHRNTKDNTGTFVELLSSPLCSFRYTVKGCVLNIESYSVLRRCIDALAAHTLLTDRLLFAHHRSIGKINLTTDLQFPQKFSSLRNLVYQFLSDVWPNDFSKLIVSLPNLESLSVYAVYDGTRSDIPPPPSLDVVPGHQADTFLPNLKTLRLRMSNLSDFLHWILNYPGYIPQITTLDILIGSKYSYGWGAIGALQLFLAANSGTLEHLSLGIMRNSNVEHDPAVSSLDIGNLPSLRSLAVRSYNVNALCHTVVHFLTGRQSTLQVLNLKIDSYSFITAAMTIDPHVVESWRSQLRESFDGNFVDEIMLFRLNVIVPATNHILFDKKLRDGAEMLWVDLLPNWETTGRLQVGLIVGGQPQPDSLESSNEIIWGIGQVPFGPAKRIGTL